jgi:chemotaxis protein methyltransferase CheR
VHGTHISDGEFARFQRLIHDIAGIHLAGTKKPLLCGRLGRRLRGRGLASYGEYYALVTSGREPEELQTCVNLLTTNETYFFREPRHFEHLRERVLPEVRPGRAFLAWSAACSSGEEPCSMAMVIADRLGLDAPWEVLASDINSSVLARASAGHYPMQRTGRIPGRYLQRFCLKGVGSQAGTFLVDAPLRAHLRFARINLRDPPPGSAEIDGIFLRNVLIYLDPGVKRQVVGRLAARLRPGGLLFVGHAESLLGVCDALTLEAPTVYRRLA